MINWNEIDTVFLDMDGTLLDLYFDSHLWKEHLPRRYAEKNSLEVAHAKELLATRIKAKEGSLDWYCLDYWTRELDIDVSELERELADLIAVRPRALELLTYLRRRSLVTVLTTNAHRRSLVHKLARTGISEYFDVIVSSHDFGIPKEQTRFWTMLDQRVSYDPARTLLIDDNPNVLRSARTHGIRHLMAVALPDSRGQRRQHPDFIAIEDFAELIAD